MIPLPLVDDECTHYRPAVSVDAVIYDTFLISPFSIVTSANHFRLV